MSMRPVRVDRRPRTATMPNARTTTERKKNSASVDSGMNPKSRVRSMEPSGSQSLNGEYPVFNKKSEVTRPNASVITGNASPRARNVGMPTTTITSAPNAPDARRIRPISTCQPRRHLPGHRRSEGDERHLAEAHLPGPPTEHDERYADERVDRDHSHELHAVAGEDDRDQRDPEHEEETQHPPGDADGRLGSELRGYRANLTRLLPGRRRRAREPRECARPLYQQREHDDRGDDRRPVRVGGVVVARGLRHDAEADRRARHRGQPFHATDDRRAERAEQERGIEHLAEGRSIHADAQEHRHEREERGESPHHTLQAAHRDAEQGCPVGTLGGGAQRNADRAEAEEQR